MKSLIATITLLIVLLPYTKAQKSPIKYGKVTKTELEMTQCDFYPEATSMILGKTGFLRFAYHADKGWQYKVEITIRKKIFKTTDKDQGNIRIRTYHPEKGTSREEITGLKATTYNLDGEKIKKSKLANSEEYRTRINDYRTETSFALPDIQEGSVIEYKYTITSDYIYNLFTWQFQDDIPTAYSYFDFSIPDYFKYHTSQIGSYLQLNITESSHQEKFTYRVNYSDPGIGGEGNVSETREMTPQAIRKIVFAENIIPVIDEPMTNNDVDRPSRLEFQLKLINIPGRPIQNIASNYPKFNNEILEWTSFGGVIDKGFFAKNFVESLEEKNDSEKAASIYSWISQNISWNEYYGVTSEKAGRATFKEQSGSAAEINLTLVAALRAADLNANPVILSTRGHGTAHPVYPNMQDFNYTIASVEIDDKQFLLDGTSKLPFGMLPVRCLNGQGWMASENGGKWINLKNGEHSTLISSEINLSEEEIHTSYSIARKGYAGINTYNKVKDIGEESYATELAESFDEGTVEKFNFDESNKVNNVKLSFEHTQEVYDTDVIYINPVQYGAMNENPFKREERYSPVDFKYGIRSSAITKLTIPENYDAELPKQIIIKLPDNGGSFTYGASQIGNVINIFCKMVIKKQDFSVEEYSSLRQFYQLIADKNNEVIVLTKNG